jgi:hypothetical protein
MLFLSRWFGVTGSDSDRSPSREESDIKEIVERVLLMQAKAAAQQHQPLRRGTHAKGICARAQFEVFDLTVGRDRQLASRLAKGTCDRYLSPSTSLGKERLLLARTLAGRISHCKTRQLCP